MITSITVNGVKLYGDYTLNRGTSAIITLEGRNFTKLSGIILSATRAQFYTSLTAVNYFTRQPGLTGQLLDYTVLNDNIVQFSLPITNVQCTVTFMPFNAAGWSTSSETMNIFSLSGTTTNIVIV
jgi:hypothetical protein